MSRNEITITRVQAVRETLTLAPRYLLIHKDYSGVIASFASYVDVVEIRAFIGLFLARTGTDKIKLFDVNLDKEVPLD